MAKTKKTKKSKTKKKKKRVDGPTKLRTGDGKIALCEFCNKPMLLVPEDQNSIVEMQPEIKRTAKGVIVTRRFRHSFCYERNPDG